jgi:hypothetical protein
MSKIFLFIGAILGGIGAILGLGFEIKFGLVLVVVAIVFTLLSFLKL